MELLNNQERELLAKYNQLLPTNKNQEPIKYSDVFLGKHDMETVPTLSKEKKIQNAKLSIKNSSASKKDQFKNIISELNNVQARQIDNIFKNGALFDENSKQKSQQIQHDCKVTVSNENISQQPQSRQFSDRPEKQPRQQSALGKEYPEKIVAKPDKKSKKETKCLVDKNSNANDIQQLFNEKLLQQVDRLVSMKKIDDNFFYNLVKKHLDECPQFGKRLKEEIKGVLNQLQ